MKRIIVSMLLLLLLAGCSSDRNMFIGEWTGTSTDGEKMTFKFDSDGYVTLIDSKGNVIGGKEFKSGNKTMSLKYTVNRMKDPVWLDFTSVIDGKETRQIKGIVKFADQNSMQVNLPFDSRERPTEFSGKDIFTLKKVR